MTTKKTYTADDMETLTGLTHVRKRPGMYIGTTDSKGLNHLVWEIVDNAVDESLAGYCSEIVLTLDADGSVKVEDNGRGIPTGINSKTKESGVEMAVMHLNSGGKFGGGGYKSSGGLHGVGSSVVNALSERFTVTVHQDKKEHTLSASRGIAGVFNGEGPDAKFTAKKGLQSQPDKRSAAEKKRRPTGTTVQWWHDRDLFLPTAELDIEAIKTRARQTAFLVPGLNIVVNDFRNPDAPDTEEFRFEGGIADMAEHLTTGEPLHDVISLSGTGTYEERVPMLDEKGHNVMQDVTREVEVNVALRWTKGYDATLRSFVNVVSTPLGGTHVRGLEQGVRRVFQDGIKNARGLLTAKEKEIPLVIEDFFEGCVAIISVNVPEPQFDGQTKEILGTKPVTAIVRQVISDELGKWVEVRKNAPAVKVIQQKIAEAMRVRVAARLQKETARRKTALQSASMPAKLVDCSETGTEFTELLICEGDSALGTLKAARDSRYQALLPIRGKILNVHKSSPSETLKNKEVSDIIQVIGAGSGRTFDPEQMRVSRVIMTADADVDGAHITTLLTTMFYRLMRPLIEEGRLYTAVPPLYIIKISGKNGETFYAENDEEKDKIVARLTKQGKKLNPLRRLKGLGEVPAETFWQTTLNPETRTLRQVTLEDAELSAHMLDLAMGSEVAPRKEWIMNSRDKLSETDLDI